MTPDRRISALAGLAAVAVALAVGELLALAVGPLSSPVVAVGGVIVDHVPEALKEFAISLFGTYDKIALQVGTVVILAAVGAGLGVLAIGRPRWAFAGVAVFGLVGAAAAVTRHDADWVSVIPSLFAAAAGAAILWNFRSRLVPVESAADPDPVPASDRRRFLITAGSLLGAGVATAAFGRWYGLRRTVDADRAAVTLPVPAEPAPVLPAEAELNIPRLAPFVTPNDKFYLIDTALVVPQVSPSQWRLKIHGRVRKPLTLTYEQLLARPMIERYVTLACVSNEVGDGLIGNAKWLGVRVADLLAEADPEPGADQVVSRSVDGFTAGTPTEVLRDGRDAMLAVGMNGVPLPIEHGFPVRMVVPGLYGYVSATKWLAELELTSFADFDAYWIKRGWAAKAPIKLQSRIDTPIDGGKVSAGQVPVAGVAWAQHVGVSGVEVRVGDGAWQRARLSTVPSVDTWCQWTWAWDAPPGKHWLEVRAYDASGNVQTDAIQDVLPDGATGHHRVEVTVT
ncbi:oxidoreductase [Virgisporangium aliadipatigenens]|uniref:Oxidoreductase n=1 Tax=Virgisporangium aliadipatigenens TaxID=741659 RepID=A0A8J3YGP6_9ACTN|nr:molybdopterin-dependent oxidoreductase [Virgisporangium aliadipatigenens]GIJ44746.1 oxidoreductase [Virgisporangium aliadipatigenens]